MNNLEANISIFFQEPSNFDERQSVYSTLFLLRRDASLCFGYDPNNNQKINFEALFPATMAVLGGIDLVAKFVYGDAKDNVGKRFTNYIEKYIDSNFQVELFQLRNSLLHSFGLYSEDRSGKIYYFVLTRNLGSLIKEISNKSFAVDIEILWKKFEESIIFYHNDLNVSPDLKNIFSEMFPKYGLIAVQ